MCRLDLSGCGVGDGSCPSLCRLLEQQPSLTWLSLARNQLTAKGTAALLHSLALNRTLTAIHLQHNHLHHPHHSHHPHSHPPRSKQSGEGEEVAEADEAEREQRVEEATAHTERSSTLRCLHAHLAQPRLPSSYPSRSLPPTGCCTIHSTLTSALFRCFSLNACVEEVDLRCCQLSDWDVCSLASGVASNLAPPPPTTSRLRRLRLSGNLLSAAVGPLLLTFLRLRPPLSSISLRSTCVSFRHLQLISAQCARLRVDREEKEPRRLRRLIQSLQRDAVAFKQAQRQREELQAQLREVQQRVEQLEGSTRHVEHSHRAELRRAQAQLDAELALEQQSAELFDAQCRERMASEATHHARVSELEGQLDKERQQRRMGEQRLQQLQRDVEDVVKARPQRVEQLKRQLLDTQQQSERVQAQVVHMRREHSRIQQAVATHQPVPHLLLYARQLRSWYEHDRRRTQAGRPDPAAPQGVATPATPA